MDKENIKTLVIMMHPDAVPMPIIEVAPSSVLINFPAKINGKLFWQGLQLSPEEAIETGMMLMAGAEESMEKDFDA